jgi:alpha-glucosidase
MELVLLLPLLAGLLLPPVAGMLPPPVAASAPSPAFSLGALRLQWTDGRLEFVLDGAAGPVLAGRLGAGLPGLVGAPRLAECLPGAGLCLAWPGLADLAITEEDSCFAIHWTVQHLQLAEDCIAIGPALWYGGPEEMVQRFPLDPAARRARVPYLPGDMLQDPERYLGGVAEPFWVSSRGAGLWAGRREQPLWYRWNRDGDGQLCLSVEHRPPYMAPAGPLELQYSVCARADPKEMFQEAAGRLWPLPAGTPDLGMMARPVWSSWAEYKQDINQSVVLDFAHSIKEHGFESSQVEIDDKWEKCYGDAAFDTAKFPDPAGMVTALQALGHRVTLWIHPFINQECAAFPPAVAAGRLVRDQEAGPGLGGAPGGWLPGMTWWWAGRWAGYVDFTNTEAAEWWRDRLLLLRDEVGLDSFKFDAGEAKWLPSSYVLSGSTPVTTWPGVFSTAYLNTCAQFGPLVEVRTGRRSQHLPVWVRMLDKYSTWGHDNGLRSMITTLLQFGMVGYPFVLPDMVGGNGYAEGPPSRELYIRWMQANVFMPSMQISFVPWRYDQEVVQHALNLTRLHAEYAPTIEALARQATEDGSPICRPVWWLDPRDPEALAVEDAFLLGDSLLAAPVLVEGAVTRDVYLPRGVWRDGITGAEWSGPVWLRAHPAPLLTLPYFIRTGEA